MKRKEIIRGIIILNTPLVLVLIALNTPLVSKFLPMSALTIFSLSILFLALCNILYYTIILKMVSSIQSIEIELSKIAEGTLSANLNLKSNPLFKLSGINTQIIKIVSSLKNTINSIEDIASGKLDTGLLNEEEQNLIDRKLAILQETLINDKAELEKTKIAESKRSWITTGLTRFGEILRQDSANIQAMGYNIISNLVDYANLNQGALYILNTEGHDEYYESIASVAYDRQKSINAKFMVGEGLVGQCAFEKERIYMTHLPADYITITSGLGKANPTNLLIVPCLIEDKVFGIIEVASFNLIEDYQIEFVERLGESIASSISNFQIAERTNRLLEASKNQAEELAAQEEELRQNLEEMETTQEDLHRQMELNAKMQKELKIEKNLFDTMLSNIPARINFKNNKHEFIRASKSFLDFFGKESNEAIIGKTDVDFFGAEFAAKTMADEKEIMASKQGRINFIEYQKKDDGTEMWKNVSKIPLLDEEGNCIGLFASVYDITDFKKAELENEKLKEEIKTLNKK